MTRQFLQHSTRNKPHHNSVSWMMVLVLIGSISNLCSAGEASSSRVINDDMHYYNPLEHGRIESQHWIRNDGLSNVQLQTAAHHIRSSEMSGQQRALNHQWLNQQGHNDVKLGSKVITKLLKMGLRTYWDGVRNKHYRDNAAVPDGSGDGRIAQDVDYKIRLSGNRLKLSVSYEF